MMRVSNYNKGITMISQFTEYLALSTLTDSLFTFEYFPAINAFSAIYRCPINGSDVHYDFNDGEFEQMLVRKQLIIIGKV